MRYLVALAVMVFLSGCAPVEPKIEKARACAVDAVLVCEGTSLVGTCRCVTRAQWRMAMMQ